MRASKADIDNACHVCPGLFLVFQGPIPSNHFIHLKDPLWFGPCDRDPVRHAQKRRAFLEEFLERDLLANDNARRRRRKMQEKKEGFADTVFASSDLAERIQCFPKHLPVVLWTSPVWTGRIPFWWILDSIRREALPRERFFVAEPQMLPSFSEWHLVSCNPDQVEDGFSRKKPLTARLLSEGSSLWRKYGASSPLAFDKSRNESSACFGDLHKSLEPFGLFFPRIHRSSELRLSEWDEILLEGFSRGNWLRPSDVLTAKGSRWRQLIMHFPDLFLLDRLRDWASWRPESPCLLRRPMPTGVSPFTWVEYQLTERGRKILKKGITAIDDAPAMEIGGTRVYDRRFPWSRRMLKNGWRIERFQGG